MLRSISLVLLFVAALFAVGVSGCRRSQDSDIGGSDGDKRPTVVATTTMIADLVRVLGGEDFRLVAIMKTGEDPHVYDVRPNDAHDIAGADLVLMNGFHLEATLGKVVEHNATGKVVRLAEEAGIKPLGPLATGGAPDPHVWMDPTLWGQCSAVVARVLTDLLPDKAETIAKRQATYLSQLKALHKEIRAMFEAVPTERRVMVTSHDAFAYFGRAYDIEVHAVIGISTEQQPRPRDVEALHSLVRSRGVKAVFIETSTSATLNAIVEKVAQETGASVGGTLYSDSLGSLDTPAGTYLGMMRHNARTIANAFTQAKP